MQPDINNPYTAPESQQDSDIGEFAWLRFIPAMFLMLIGLVTICFGALATLGAIVSSFELVELVALALINGAGIAWILAGISCWKRRYRETFFRAMIGLAIVFISMCILPTFW